MLDCLRARPTVATALPKAGRTSQHNGARAKTEVGTRIALLLPEACIATCHASAARRCAQTDPLRVRFKMV